MPALVPLAAIQPRRQICTSGPSSAAPQFTRAVPADAAGLQPAEDTLGTHSPGQDLAPGGISSTHVRSRQGSARFAALVHRYVSLAPIQRTGLVHGRLKRASMRVHICRLCNTHTHTHTRAFTHVCGCQGMLVGAG